MLLTQNDLGEMLGIGQSAVKALIATREMPYAAIIGGVAYFCPEAIIVWAKSGPNLLVDGDRIESLRRRLTEECPAAAKAFRDFGKRFAERRTPRRYYLVAMPSKKMGHTWYVKYLDKGRLVPSKWSTGTSDKEAAAVSE